MNDNSQTEDTLAPWKILIADDDRDVHTATRMALRNVSFHGRGLEFIDAWSGEETLTALRDNPDTAVVLLDVIMETEDAGLNAARSIRENGFKLVRIILRTGFPGQAPVRNVIVDYDIHDYKEKSGLTAQQLFTSLISALRAYDDLVALESHRRGLMSVLESVSWFDFNTVQNYVSGMLAEFSDLAQIGSDRIVIAIRTSSVPNELPTVVASMGDWQEADDLLQMESLPPATFALMVDSLNKMQALSGGDGKTLYSHSHGFDLVVFAGGHDAFSQADEVLLDVFLNKVCQAISNHRTFADMAKDRDAVLRGLALRTERWNNNAATELERLAGLVSAISIRLNTTLVFPGEINSQFMRDIGIAAMLHDLGNESLGELLSRSAPFKPEEQKLMQTHVAAGTEALEFFLHGACNSGALSMARNIISCHHERFDGAGYPGALRGDAIPLEARLVAVADAYVAMTSSRPYRPAMQSAEALAAIKSGEDRQFDQRITQAFFEVIDRGFSNSVR